MQEGPFLTQVITSPMFEHAFRLMGRFIRSHKLVNKAYENTVLQKHKILRQFEWQHRLIFSIINKFYIVGSQHV